MATSGSAAVDCLRLGRSFSALLELEVDHVDLPRALVARVEAELLSVGPPETEDYCLFLGDAKGRAVPVRETELNLANCRVTRLVRNRAADMFALYDYGAPTGGIFHGGMLVETDAADLDREKRIGILIYNEQAFNRAKRQHHEYWDWWRNRNEWAELQDMCWQKGHNWNNLETVEKRGLCVYRREVVVEGRQGPVTRLKFLIDRDIPIFTSQESAEWWSRFLRV